MSDQATVFYDVARSALECVCNQMDLLAIDDAEYFGCPCLQFVSAGEPAIDCCVDTGCDGVGGMLAVHVESIFPSGNFPNPFGEFEPCKAATWVASIVVTVARCAPTVDKHGNPAPAEDLDANGLVMAKDQWAVVTGLSCCLVADAPTGKRKRRVQIGESRPMVSEGGCASFEVRAFVEAGGVCDCGPDGS